MRNGTLVLLLVGLALLGGFLVTDGFGSTPGAPRERGASGRGDGAALARISARLDEMAAALARLERRESASVVSPAPRAEPPRRAAEETELRTELAAVAAVLRDLQAAVAAGRAQAAPHGAGPRALAALHGLHPETDWTACDRLVQTWRADREAGRQSVLFHSPAELLEELGAPTRVRGEEEGEVRWTYGTGPDAPRDYRIDLSLFDGYVTALNVRD